MTHRSEHIQALEMFALGGLSCGEIADQLQVSARTVKRWRAAWKAEGGKPGKGSPKAARTREEPPAAPAATRAPAYRPAPAQEPQDAIGSPLDYWAAGVVRALSQAAEAWERRHSQAASLFETLADKRFKQLTEARAGAGEATPEADLSDSELLAIVLDYVASAPEETAAAVQHAAASRLGIPQIRRVK